MGTRTKVFALGAVFTFFWFGVGVPLAQYQPSDSQAVSLTVQPGVPLHIALEKPVLIKHAGVPVQGHLLEPIYVFDHLVIPAGSEIQGRVTEVDNASRKRCALAMANGNFTPLRMAKLDFDTLLLKDGKRVPLQTLVSPGTPDVIHLTAGGDDSRKKGRVKEAVARGHEVVFAKNTPMDIRFGTHGGTAPPAPAKPTAAL